MSKITYSTLKKNLVNTLVIIGLSNVICVLSEISPATGSNNNKRDKNINISSINRTISVAEQESLWKKEYENYLQLNITQEIMQPQLISHKLEMMNKLTGTKSAVVYLIPRDQDIVIILLMANQRPINKSIAISRSELLGLTKALQQEVTARKNLSFKNPTYLPLSQKLYSLFIAPVANELETKNIDNLIFCVGTGLRSFPFAALHDGKNFLVQNYSISLIPAFSLTDATYTDIRNVSVLAMGASLFPDQEPLPAVPVELAAITQSKGGVKFLNEKFTIENLRSQQTQKPHKIVHLATHGVFNAGTVDDSYIKFWNTKLRLRDLSQLQLNQPPVELLVLSACQTALGNQQAELGFSGLALQAGVKSAIGSLWSVSDAGTLALMTELYRNLKTAPIKAKALQQAQIAMITGQIKITQGELRQAGLNRGVALPPEIGELGNLNLSHPYFWSAFTMIGSPW
ncbi:hypothetical protein B6N60_01593 [Richelia sinica FACHB-800]|uniref:CHAT domain-containing protein n=1 Tax=Richelia sinica FACHB-800 TaxID=1357546 RepID=A0A975Y482_9NOST|nr:CHAT domain-containing protein [Richelia sinica]MBD2663545.1 CHAT domain-containing protein [Richelia sinica FACHB-800]QXE22906.1 hypothetical protein B6N60_01593 [Richelia sinica FACHB-800]